MNKTNEQRQVEDYRRLENVIRFIQANHLSNPTLAQMAQGANLSQYHFERLFKRWVGISPVQFRLFLTLEYAKKKLRESQSLLDTAYEAGMSGPGRLHDLFVSMEAVTPGEFKRGGKGLRLEYGFHATPFGWCLIAVTERGICHLAFVDANRTDALCHLKNQMARSRDPFESTPDRSACEADI